MTQPYYTATQGPVDPKAGFRAKLYAGLAALTGIIGLAQAFGLLDVGQATSIGQIATGLGGLFGAGGLALAASKTSAQTKDGTFDPAPPPPPAITAVESISAVANQFQDLTKSVAAGITHVTDTAAGLQNILSAGLSQVLPGSLVDQILRQHQTS